MSSKKTPTKKQQVAATKNTAAVEKATGLQVDKALTALSTAGLSIQSTLAKVGEELIAKVADLKAVDTAIALKNEELENLHGKDKILLSIDELRVEHEKTIQQLADEVEEQRLANEAAQAAEVEQRRREQEEFEYQLTQSRKTESDNWKEQLRIRQRDELIRQEQFEKNFKEREEQLALKEKAYNEALAKAATFEDEVKKASAKEVAIATSALKKEYEHEKKVTEITHKAEVDRLNAANENLTKQFTAASNTISELQAQLKEAYTKNTELAAKAVDGAANTKQVADLQSLITNVGGNGQRART